MPKLIEAKILDKILNFFSGDSPKNTKDKFLNTIKDTDPVLAKAFSNWEDSFVDLLNATKAVKLKHKQDTKTVDALLKKYKG